MVSKDELISQKCKVSDLKKEIENKHNEIKKLQRSCIIVGIITIIVSILFITKH